MTEISRPWAGTATGDAGPYSDDAWSDMYRILFTRDRANQCVLAGHRNELAVSGTSSPVSVAAGGALVDGKFYDSDAAETVAIPTPAGATRIDRIVLRKDFSAQTVRITRVAGSEGGGAPSITQVDGNTWDVSLAQCSITTGGVITVTDERQFVTATILGVPANTVMYVTGGSAPSGWSEYTSARGRMIVGLPSGGTNDGTLGTALTDLQDKTHTHDYTTVIAHTHTFRLNASGTGSAQAVGSTQSQANTQTTDSTGSASGTTATAALSDFLAYIQLMAIKKD